MESAPDVPAEGDGPSFAKTGETLRRFVLAAFSALFVARVFYPSEDASTGTGLWWVFAVLILLGLGVMVQLLCERTAFRISWVDPLVLALFALVASSWRQGLDQRPAITLAWEWVGLGAAYLLARNLTRTRGETESLALVWFATAAALAMYGLFQAAIEIPELQAAFRANPERMLRRMGVEPGSPSARLFQARVLDSKEPFATFGLANSLAGFIVGPLAVWSALAIENLRGKAPRFSAYFMAGIPALAILVCVLLTKSRSAWIGLSVAGLFLMLRAWARVSRKSLLICAAAGLTGLVVLIGLGLATKQLDRQVLTEASKSLRYRLEYWRATWDMLRNRPNPFEPRIASGTIPELAGTSLEPVVAGRPEAAAFWYGLGPGNFAGPYLRHKLPESSEEIQDPHNLVLEVWSTAGLPAAIVLVLALGLGCATMFFGEPEEVEGAKPSGRGSASSWILWGGPLGWGLVAMTGRLDPFKGDLLARWLILGATWGAAVFLMGPLWRRSRVPAAAIGAGVLAIGVNLLAAGGIGVPSVALGLWTGLAIGLTLRDERPSGRLRELPGVAPGALAACGWAALVGTFYGSVLPGWRAETAIAAGDRYAALAPPAFEDARQAYLLAAKIDQINPQPWVSLAGLEYRFWLSPDASNLPGHWRTIFLTLDKAVQAPERNPDALPLRRLQASFAREIGRELDKSGRTTPGDMLLLRTQIARAMRHAARLYPTSADIRAQLAFASADLGFYDDALQEAKIALELDALTPHLDKKLDDRARKSLQASTTTWEEARKAAAELRDKKGAAK